MPTTRKRHSITETPPVEAALDELRAVSEEERIDLGELVVLGARRKLELLRAGAADTDARLADLAERVRRGGLGVDANAAAEVRRSGWAR